MTHVIVLLDWNNYKCAKLEVVKKTFLSSDAVEKAQNLFDKLLLKQLSKKKFTKGLRKLLYAHTEQYKNDILADFERPERLLQDCKLAPEEHIFPQLQHISTHLIVVTERSTHWKKQFPDLVIERARLLADDYRGAAQEDFQGLVVEDAAEQERPLGTLEDSIKKVLRIAADTALSKAKRLETLEIPGATADEAIAGVAHANAASENPIPLCVVSNDTDFRQLKKYDTYQIGVAFPKPMQVKAADVDGHFLDKEALLGKGRDDLKKFGTVFGLIPDAVECTDVITTTVKGAHRPGDAVYAQQFADFNTAVRTERVWELEIEGILEWLQKYKCQVPSICARFLTKRVHHTIDPYSKWSAMPLDVQLCCTMEAKRVLETALATAAAPRVAPMQQSSAIQLADVAAWPALSALGQSSRSADNMGSDAGSSNSQAKPKGSGQSSRSAGSTGAGAGSSNSQAKPKGSGQSSRSAGSTGAGAGSSNSQAKPKGNRRKRGNRGRR